MKLCKFVLVSFNSRHVLFEDSKIVSACARERHAAGTEFIIIKQICGVIAKQALLR